MPWIYYGSRSAFRLGLPDQWEHEVCSASDVFYLPDGVGALNVSSMSPPKGETPNAEAILVRIRAQIGAREWISAFRADRGTRKSKIERAYAEYAEGEVAWRVWVFAAKDLVVVLSYNCGLASQGDEDEVVDQIISSFQFAVC